MTTIKYIPTYLAAGLGALLSLTACHNDDESQASLPGVPVITAAIYDIASENSSIWHSGQIFGVYMLDSERAPLAANARHIADNRGVTGYLVPEGTALSLPADGSAVSIAAYHPYDADAARADHRTTIAVSEGMAPDAYIRAESGGVSTASPRVTLGFKSQLAQISGRIICSDPSTARIVARIEGAPRSCSYDIVAGRYDGTPECSPIGATVSVLDRAFEFTAVVAATESAAGGPILHITALDRNGRELRTYRPVALGPLLRLSDSRTFAQNTVYKLAGELDAADLRLQYTGTSPICILQWDTDPDEEFGTIIK